MSYSLLIGHAQEPSQTPYQKCSEKINLCGETLGDILRALWEFTIVQGSAVTAATLTKQLLLDETSFAESSLTYLAATVLAPAAVKHIAKREIKGDEDGYTRSPQSKFITASTGILGSTITATIAYAVNLFVYACYKATIDKTPSTTEENSILAFSWLAIYLPIKVLAYMVSRTTRDLQDRVISCLENRCLNALISCCSDNRLGSFVIDSVQWGWPFLLQTALSGGAPLLLAQNGYFANRVWEFGALQGALLSFLDSMQSPLKDIGSSLLIYTLNGILFTMLLANMLLKLNYSDPLPEIKPETHNDLQHFEKILLLVSLSTLLNKLHIEIWYQLTYNVRSIKNTLQQDGLQDLPFLFKALTIELLKLSLFAYTAIATSQAGFKFKDNSLQDWPTTFTITAFLLYDAIATLTVQYKDTGIRWWQSYCFLNCNSQSSWERQYPNFDSHALRDKLLNGLSSVIQALIATFFAELPNSLLGYSAFDPGMDSTLKYWRFIAGLCLSKVLIGPSVYYDEVKNHRLKGPQLAESLVLVKARAPIDIQYQALSSSNWKLPLAIIALQWLTSYCAARESMLDSGEKYDLFFIAAVLAFNIALTDNDLPVLNMAIRLIPWTVLILATVMGGDLATAPQESQDDLYYYSNDKTNLAIIATISLALQEITCRQLLPKSGVEYSISSKVSSCWNAVDTRASSAWSSVTGVFSGCSRLYSKCRNKQPSTEINKPLHSNNNATGLQIDYGAAQSGNFDDDYRPRY